MSYNGERLFGRFPGATRGQSLWGGGSHAGGDGLLDVGFERDPLARDVLQVGFLRGVQLDVVLSQDF